MSNPNKLRIGLAAAIILPLAAFTYFAANPLAAQQPPRQPGTRPAAPTKTPTKAAPTKAAPTKAAASKAAPKASAPAKGETGEHRKLSPAEQAKKDEILRSTRWRRAIFELTEWLSAQPIYNPQQVEQIKADLNERVAHMTPEELEFMLEDMEAKFKLIETPEAKEVRAWFGHYLSVLSKKKRAEVLKDTPNLVNMTAAQLAQELDKIERKRRSREQAQAAFDRNRSAQVNSAIQQDQAAERAAASAQRAAAAQSYSSPYRTPPATRPFQDVHTGEDLKYYVTPYGGVGLLYSPSSY